MNRATPTYLHILRDFNRDVRLYLITTMLIGLTVDGGVYTVLFNLYPATSRIWTRICWLGQRGWDASPLLFFVFPPEHSADAGAIVV